MVAECGHCRDCRWWEPPTPLPSFSPPTAGELARQGWGACDLMGSDEGEPEYSETLGLARDSELYSATFECAPDFGCVQWAAKEYE